MSNDEAFRRNAQSVPLSQMGLILVTFSADTSCNGGGDFNGCLLQIVVDGSTVLESVFDQDDPNGPTYERNSTQAASVNRVCAPGGLEPPTF